MVRTSLSQGGHDWGEPNLDPLAVFYIVFAVSYTISVLLGLIWLWNLRHTTAVRLRNFWSIFAAVITIHIYTVWVILVYPLNGLFKCGEEFWVMSVLLPLGMALFQVSNVRLLSHYEEQQRLVRSYPDRIRTLSRRSSLPLMKRWCETSELQKTCIRASIGTVIQLLVTCILYFGSRRFHATYGFFGDNVSAAECRRGLEWIPSVFWQFIWSAVFGPMLILRTRHIHDTHYWGLQMRLIVVAMLPGTPLWLAGVYSTSQAFDAVNRWFVPAAWFLPGFMTVQFVSIFFPIYDARAMQSLSDKLCRGFDGSTAPSSPTSSTRPSSRRSLVVSTHRREYSLHSLDYQIENNIEPLLQWAAQKEFTAENVLFLRAVRDWKKKWQSCDTRQSDTLHHIRLQYFEASQIYFDLVDPQTAPLRINLDHHTLNDLRTLFAPLAETRGKPDASSSTMQSNGAASPRNAVAPWEDVEDMAASSSPTLPSPIASPGFISKFPSHEESSGATIIIDSIPMREISLSGSEETTVDIPTAFDGDIFDKAYDIVRNDVYVNTWSRYEARFSRPRPLGGDGRVLGYTAQPPYSVGCPVSNLYDLSLRRFGRRVNVTD